MFSHDPLCSVRRIRRFGCTTPRRVGPLDPGLLKHPACARVPVLRDNG